MPNIKEIQMIVRNTPITHAIRLISKHGMGKSEFLKSFLENEGYTVVVLFLGQMADASDLIGLPDRVEVEFENNGQIIKDKVTTFCLPKWFPRSSKEKFAIILDEFNRGKEEIYQCVMDLILNRRLNGFDLPPMTRIFACQNPINEEFDYQVKELDPAMEDRWSTYNFDPTFMEWSDWAISNNVNKLVIGFISKNQMELDPPDKKVSPDTVDPSRRSWKRVSDIILSNPDLLGGDMMDLKIILQGVVGPSATAKFVHYLKENAKGLYPGRVVTAWNDEVKDLVLLMDNQSLVSFCDELAIYLQEHEQEFFIDAGSKQAELYAYNVEKFLRTVPTEIVAYFYRYITTAGDTKKTWPLNLLRNNEKGLADRFIDAMQGKETYKDSKGYQD